MRLGRVASAVGGPQGDNEAGEALQAKGRAHVEDAEGGVGAAGDLLGEVLRQGREAQDGGGSGSGNDRKEQIGGDRQTEEQGDLGGHRQGQRASQEQLGRHAGAAQALGGGSQQQGACGERSRHEGEVSDDSGAVEPGNVGEPRRRPQALQREGHADAQGRQGGDAQEARVQVDGEEADPGGGGCRLRRLPLRHDEKDEQRHGRGGNGESGEQPAPAEGLNDRLGRTRGGQGAEGAQHDVDAIGEGDALGREPQDDGLEAGHQADGHAEADERAADKKGRRAVGECEDERSGGGKEQQATVDKARSVAVEKHAAGEHDRGEYQEVHGREQAEVRRPEAQLGGEVAGDQRVDGAEQVGEVVAGREGQQHADDEMHTGHWVHPGNRAPLPQRCSHRGRRVGVRLQLSMAAGPQPSSLRSRRQTRRAGASSVPSSRAPQMGCGRAGSSSFTLR